MTLATFLTDKRTGKVKRGALARASECLEVHKSTIVKWMSKEWKPSADMRGRIKAMIASKLDLSARCSPGRPRKSVARGRK